MTARSLCRADRKVYAADRADARTAAPQSRPSGSAVRTACGGPALSPAAPRRATPSLDRDDVPDISEYRAVVHMPGCRSAIRRSCRPRRRSGDADVSDPLTPPEILEPRWCQFGVAHRVLDISVAEVRLQRSRVVPLVGKRVTAGVAERVRR